MSFCHDKNHFAALVSCCVPQTPLTVHLMPKKRKSIDPKTTKVEIRTSSKEKGEFQRTAKAGGFSSVADYLRWLHRRAGALLSSGKMPEGFGRAESKKVDPVLLYELNKIGVNLNQIARTLNMDDPDDRVSHDVLRDTAHRLDGTLGVVLRDL